MNGPGRRLDIVLRVRETHRPKRQDLRRRAHRLVIGAPACRWRPAPPRRRVSPVPRAGSIASAALLAREPGHRRPPRRRSPHGSPSESSRSGGLRSTPTRVRELLAGQVAESEIEERSGRITGRRRFLKRLRSGQTVVLPLEGFDALERERYVRLAHGLRRPRHLILLEAPRDKVRDDERPALDELRRSLDAGELGLEGFQTALRLGGHALAELKRIVFQPPPRDD